MGRSKHSMYYAYLKEGDSVERYEPLRAIKARNEGRLEGKDLLCQNFLKQGCCAVVKAVNYEINPHFSLKPGEVHTCHLVAEEVTLSEKIRLKPDGRSKTIKIDETDLFTTSINNKHAVKKTEDKKVITKKYNANNAQIRTYIKNEYIRSVTELHEFYHTESQDDVRRVIRELIKNQLLYKTKQFEDIFANLPNSSKTFMVEGFIDYNDLTLLKNRGFLYLYKTGFTEKNIRFMLVHNGSGKTRFMNAVEDLLLFINQKNKNRMMVTVKGNIIDKYNDSRILKMHVKDIDIKYKTQDFTDINHSRGKTDLISVSVSSPKVLKEEYLKDKEIKKELEINKIESNISSNSLREKVNYAESTEKKEIITLQNSSKLFETEIENDSSSLKKIINFVRKKMNF